MKANVDQLGQKTLLGLQASKDWAADPWTPALDSDGSMHQGMTMRTPGNILAAFRPISSSCLMTKPGRRSVHIRMQHSNAPTNTTIYQLLQTNCELLPFLLHIMAHTLVKQMKQSRGFFFLLCVNGFRIITWIYWRL